MIFRGNNYFLGGESIFKKNLGNGHWTFKMGELSSHKGNNENCLPINM